MDNLVNIDLNPVCTVANNLIDKLSAAAGWAANHETPERLAVKNYIEEIQKSNLPPLEKAAIISNTKKILKEYNNQNDIVQIAIEHMKADAKPELLDDDWIAKLMDKSRLISNKEFQLIWGYLLAKECNTPSSVPVSLLYILERMDKNDAKTFNKLCSVSLYTMTMGHKSYIPMIISSKLNSFYGKIGINYEALSNLQSLGLIEASISMPDNAYSQTINDTVPITIHYFDETFQLPNEIRKFKCGNVIFTKAGQALCGVINATKIDGFFSEQCLPVWKQQIEELLRSNN